MEASQPEGTLKAQRQISVKKKQHQVSFKPENNPSRFTCYVNVRFHCFIFKSISAKSLLVNILRNVLRNPCLALVFQKDE